MKVYIINDIVLDEKSGTCYSSGSVVIGNRDKALEVFKEYCRYREENGHEFTEEIDELTIKRKKYDNGYEEYCTVKFTEKDVQELDELEFDISI